MVSRSREASPSGGVDLPVWQRISILIGLLVIGLLGLSALDPIPQDPAYHAFADTRSLVGIPNVADVVSSVGFVVVGALGVLVVTSRKGRDIFVQRRDAWPYVVFFVGVGLAGLGSAYYHWAPSNERLLWDRLPMAIAFMAFSSAIIADRIDARAGNTWLLPVLVALGLLSPVYWDWTESLGRGDLRFYGFVQFYPMVAVPLICWLFPAHRYIAGRCIAWVVVWYGLSKLLEHLDGEIFEAFGHIVGGHTLKHLAAAGATLVVLRTLMTPEPS